ncbi:methionyl-tRNA formyltransferase [Candidatus Parcubacteria bacterium]|nr:methionyl-tRNA formyltransferase [Candidatus Parcubacteria bacterium]
MSSISYVFFGTSTFSVYVLEELFKKNLIPMGIVTFPDKPQGRKLVLTPNPVKAWALTHNIRVFEKRDEAPQADVYVVASYGRILPADLIYRPKYKTLNVHPSLLPKLRGPAPIQGAILHEDKTGVTIMRIDEKMDEGPIVVQQEVTFDTWPEKYSVAERKLGEVGGKMLALVLPKWVNGELPEIEQDRAQATYTHMIEKSEADISNDSPEAALRKIKAFEVWPRARMGELIITDAHMEEGALVLDKVIPPGKKEMSYSDYLRGR